MRKRIFSAILSTFFGLGVLAAAPRTQDQSSTEHKDSRHRHQADPHEQANRLGKRLNLTEDQKNKLLPILTERQQQMKSIHEDSSLSQQDRRAKMQSLWQDSDAKIKALLNDNQKQTYDQLQEQRRERMQQHRQDQGETNRQSQ